MENARLGILKINALEEAGILLERPSLTTRNIIAAKIYY